MESESGVTGSIIDELHSWDIQLVQIKDEGGITRSLIDQLYSSEIQGDQMEGESCVTRMINFILRISKEIKSKVKVV